MFIFPCSADHGQDWQPEPVDPYSAIICVWGTRSSILDRALDAGLSCTKGVWYIYDWDTG